MSYTSAEERICNLVDQWMKDPNSAYTEEHEIERADAVMEFFGFPEEFRKAELDDIRARHASARANARASA